MVLFVVAGCAVLVGGGLTAAVLADDRPMPVAARSGQPSPTARPETTREVGRPLCVVGSWVVVEEVANIKFYSDQPALPMTSAGTTYEFRPDGTGSARLDGVVVRGTFQGNELRVVGRGGYEFTWSATDKVLTYHGRTRSDATWTFYDQRGELSTQPVQANPAQNEVDDYTCQATRLVESNSGGYRAAMSRTALFGVYG
ncbi:hypothetical protein B0I31_104326 [Saccharothrix carnea]|uniref:Uncharacterized protein n=1 Tax=Saccharothrix carnea TaxID=1280637 RepID=A0A2P8IC46_SACCR|nr:hypothetical protein B0I31_104326 [Saccharothrix carnea]